ncbi:MAG: prenyltransferase/squalene oxidase repeat-containing protein [Verrucomicrobiota bacterium]
MKTKTILAIITALCVAATIGVIHVQSEEASPPSEGASDQQPPQKPTLISPALLGNNAVIDAVAEPREKAEAIRVALQWLVSRQQKNGGWGPGHVAAGVEERTTVGNTCIALQALAWDGNSPTSGPYQSETAEAIQYVLAAIEESDATSLFVSPIRDSQLQRKLGVYVDTFIAASVLPEFKGKMGSGKEEKKLHEGVAKLLAKIEAHQSEDGSWKDTGWAPTLSQGFAGKSINRAAQKGWQVDEKVRERAEEFAQKNFDHASGTFSREGSAGIALYSSSSNLQQIQESAITNRQLVKEL